MKRPNMDVDRISELPEYIIHRIMSNLSRYEVFQTSLLSKRWYRMQKNYPLLGYRIGWNSGANLRKHIFKSLHHFSHENLSLRSFSLEIGQDKEEPGLSSNHDAWLKLALANGVSELKLRILYIGDDEPEELEEHWNLPESIYNCKTLKVLELSGYSMCQPLSSFSSLTKLSLEHCNLTQHPVLLKSVDCPFLEVLVIRSCLGVHVTKIKNLPRLHTVELILNGDDDMYRDGNVEDNDDGGVLFFIAGQSIEMLTISSSDFQPWSIFNIGYCRSLKFLRLHSEKITDGEFHSLISNLPLLEELYLVDCNVLENVKISSSTIKTLMICIGEGSITDSVQIEAPNLKNFIFIADQKQCVVKVADCCCNLVTLVLHWPFITETLFDGLVSKFPLLENLCILGCNELERIQLQNLRLKRLHIVRCCKFKDVSYTSGNSSSFEFYLKAYEHTAGGLIWLNRNDDWWIRLEKFLSSSVGIRDESLCYMIHKSLFRYPKVIPGHIY